MNENTEFNVESGASKGTISRAFKKMLGSKSTNKKLLNSFVEYVSGQTGTPGVANDSVHHILYSYNTKKTQMPFAPVPVSTEDLVSYLTDNCGTEVNTKQLFEASEHFNCSLATVKKRLKDYKQGIGKWNLTVQERLEKTYEAPAAPAIQQNLVPSKDDNYVPFGNFTDVKKIIQSGIFYPTFITGLSGNGKTFSVEQACAALNRELIRVNITIETDEDDLIGGFRLVDGNTVWHNGPVVEGS